MKYSPCISLEAEWFYRIVWSSWRGASTSIRDPEESMKYPVKFCSDWWRGICQKWKCWGDIQNKISEWKGILYRKGWFVWETPSSLVCPGSRVYGYETQDMDKIKERLMIKFSRCQAKQLKFISKSLESHWNISSKEMVLYFFYFVKIAIIISMKRYGSALWKERPFGRDKEY